MKKPPNEESGHYTVDQETVRLLETSKLTVAVAESCTGGLLGHRITNVAGCSTYFRGGIVAYSDEAKEGILGVSRDTFVEEGAVSRTTALQMAMGVRKTLDADIGIATTGIAGPGGGSADKPVGLAFVALVDRQGTKECHEYRWMGGRSANKHSTADAALELLKAYLQSRSSE